MSFFFMYVAPLCSTLNLNLMAFRGGRLFHNRMRVVLALANGLHVHTSCATYDPSVSFFFL